MLTSHFLCVCDDLTTLSHHHQIVNCIKVKAASTLVSIESPDCSTLSGTLPMTGVNTINCLMWPSTSHLTSLWSSSFDCKWQMWETTSKISSNTSRDGGYLWKWCDKVSYISFGECDLLGAIREEKMLLSCSREGTWSSWDISLCLSLCLALYKHYLMECSQLEFCRVKSALDK
jgi:hypothetical protein